MTVPQQNDLRPAGNEQAPLHAERTVADIGAIVRPWDVAGGDIMGIVGDARYVLIGEASHGTDEFYRERAALTRRLITEKGFSAVAVEADWPDAYRVNRYVQGTPDDADAERALGGFRRFPQWMWRNTVVTEFVEWLRDHDDAQVFVCAHDSHLGDARAMETGVGAGWIPGQLARERVGGKAVLIGFSTNAGTVAAAVEREV